MIAISVSRGRDPCGTRRKDRRRSRARGDAGQDWHPGHEGWIALRTSTEEQFVSMRFDEILLKRVLLALEERTGHQPQFIELPKEKD